MNRSRAAVLTLSAVLIATGSIAAYQLSRAAHANHVRRHALSYTRDWTANLDANADSPAVTVDNVTFPGNVTKNVVLVLAGNNDNDCDPGSPVSPATTYAFDAANGHKLWSANTTGQGRCTTSAPAYYNGFVYNAGLDGKIHKYDITNGNEYMENGWPIKFTLNPYREKQSSDLRVSPPYLYATTSGFTGDEGHYEGHVVTINLDTNAVAVWNSLCSHKHVLESPNSGDPSYCQYVQNGMFGRGQAVMDPLNGDIYVVTGNGPWNGTYNWGDSILKLSHNGSKLVDAFTPTNQAWLNGSDSDLGSTAPDILPPFKVKGKTWNLLVQGGKGGYKSESSADVLWLVNRDKMGSHKGPGSLGGQLQHITSPGGCEVLTGPAEWTGAAGKIHAIYTNSCGMKSYLLSASGSKPKLASGWSKSGRFTTPVISDNKLYVAQDGELDILDPYNGHTLWTSNDSGSGGTIGSVHWEYPTVNGNMLYMTDEDGQLIAYSKD